MSRIRCIFFLVGLLVMAGGTAFADSTNFISSADATAQWGSSSYIIKAGTSGDVDYADQEKTMAIRHSGTNVYEHSWGLAKFDLSSIPAGVLVTNASINFAVTLNNWPASANFAPMGLFVNAEDWVETGSGSNAPAKGSSPVQTLDSCKDWGGTLTPFTGANELDSSFGGWLTFSGSEVAEVVNYWVNGALPNYGVAIEPVGTNYTDTERYFMLQTKEQVWDDGEGGFIYPSPYITVDYVVTTSATCLVTDDATAEWEGVAARHEVVDTHDYGFGTDYRLVTRHDGVMSQHAWALAKFDLSSLPDDITILYAGIHFVVEASNFPGPTNYPPMALRNNLGDWNEGGGMEAPPRDTLAVQTLDYFYDWDLVTPIPFTGTNAIANGTAGWMIYNDPGVLELVKGWHNGSITNCGVSVEPVGDYTDTERYLLLNGKGTGWGEPYLTVSYYTNAPSASAQVARDASDDSFVAFWHPEDASNFGTNTYMELRSDVVTNYALAKFDLSPFAGQIVDVKSAKIRFFVDPILWPGPTNFSPVAIFQNTSGWDESTVTALTAPGYDASAIETMDHFSSLFGGDNVYFTGTNSIPDEEGWLEYSSSNVADLVEGWMNGTTPNHGVTIRTTESVDSFRLFWLQSKEATAVGTHPKLLIEYDVIGYYGYESWATGMGISTNSKTDDYEPDGLINLMEYAFGGNPNSDDAAAISPVIEVGSDIVHVYRKRVPSELTYELYVDQNYDLVVPPGWTNASAYAPVETTGPTVDFIQTVTNTFIGAGDILDKAFLKLEVSD